MHRSTLFTAVILGLALFLLAPAAGTRAETTILKVPICSPDFPTCGFALDCPDAVQDDVLDLQGNVLMVVRSTTDGRGGIHLGLHLNFQGVTGIGQTTGDRYRVILALNSVELDVPTGAPSVTTFTQAFQLNQQGAAANRLALVTFHVTVDANGRITAEVDHVQILCRG
jgi:hypothetical protein